LEKILYSYLKFENTSIVNIFDQKLFSTQPSRLFLKFKQT